jgi:hypothetical protein
MKDMKAGLLFLVLCSTTAAINMSPGLHQFLATVNGRKLNAQSSVNEEWVREAE